MENHNTTTGTGNLSAVRIVREIHSDSDGHNRQSVYALCSDGSAMTYEITRHLRYAGSADCTNRERHAIGSEMALLVQRLASLSPLPSGWYNV
jgi:hypothetical protein